MKKQKKVTERKWYKNYEDRMKKLQKEKESEKELRKRDEIEKKQLKENYPIFGWKVKKTPTGFKMKKQQK